MARIRPMGEPRIQGAEWVGGDVVARGPVETRDSGRDGSHMFAAMFHVKHQLVSWEPAIESLAADLARAKVCALNPNQRTQLAAFGQTIIQWAVPAGLTKIASISAIAQNHFLDSLLGCAVLGTPATVSDVGTGPGIPGLPLAIAMPDTHFTLVDSRRKSISFLEFVVATLGLPNVSCLRARAGQDPLPISSAVVARCVRPPQQIAPLLLTLAEPGGIVALWVKQSLSLGPWSRALEASGQAVSIVDVAAGSRLRRFLAMRRKSSDR